MADMQKLSFTERDIELAITTLKRGTHLLKYGRRGKPKFHAFRLSPDESALVWYDGKDEKQLKLCLVSRIIPGQRTAIFQRHRQPEKKYQSFSLIYDDRSLDLICKDKEEAEVWFTGLKALIERNGSRFQRNDSRKETAASGSLSGRRVPSSSSDQGDIQVPEDICLSKLGKTFADVLSLTQSAKNSQSPDSTALFSSCQPVEAAENSIVQASEVVRMSLSSAVSSSSQGSCIEDFDNLGDVFIWGEGAGDGVLGGGLTRVDRSSNMKTNALLPKLLESTMMLDVQNIACGHRHAALVSKQGEIFSWGEENGGKLGHGVEADVSHPKLIEALSGKSIEMVACGSSHTCAITPSGDLYTWGGGSHNCGLLGHRSNASHWIPKKVTGPIEGLQVSYAACGPWHTALLMSTRQLFTFGDGTFGALGHGDQSSTNIPREVESLKGLRTLRVACGSWHTAAVVELSCISVESGEPKQTPDGKLFTWGDGDKGRLGHGDHCGKVIPECVAALIEEDFSRVACGDNFTIALTTSGRVYVIGSMVHHQQGSSAINGMKPVCLEGDIAESCVEEIASGAHHVAVLTSKAEVYTWGKGTLGQLGHGDKDDRSMPTLVHLLKDKQVKSIACGSNFTAAVCLHKGMSSIDNSLCAVCHSPFNFIRKRHNCYNCGLILCKACSSKKSLKASLAPSRNKLYRVCDDCFVKLQKTADSTSVRTQNGKTENSLNKTSESSEKDSGMPRIRAIISRLSSAESFKSDRSPTTENHVFPLQNGSVHRRSASAKSSSTAVGGPLQNFIPFYVPDHPKSISQSLSPARGKSPWRSTASSPSSSVSFFTPETIFDDLKSSNHNLNMEVRSLKAQVEKLSSKSHNLEAELERKSKLLEEAKTQAVKESEKNRAAEEVIKCLAAQLKEMAERKVPEGQGMSSHCDIEGISCLYNGACVGSTASSNSASSSNSNPTLSNGTKDQVLKSDQIEDEPGVYITIVSQPNGANELKTVRFKYYTAKLIRDI